MARFSAQQRISLTILVAALGYFVDVFDLQLFTMVRVSSLKDFGLSADEIASTGSMLLNWQMAGMLLGGILWGVWGDKKGRVTVLFGTILLYSIANIANAFAANIPEYAIARFFAGFGLAGEIGAGITLTSELLPKNTRGLGTTVVVCCGVFGPFVAGYVADAFEWKTVYILGGVLGLLLFALRVSVNESGIFDALKTQTQIKRGRLRMLFLNPKRLLRYLKCITIALPVWFVIGSVVIFSPELGKFLGIATPLKATTATMTYYIGATFGNLLSGLLSQVFKTRKKIFAVQLIGQIATFIFLFTAKGLSAEEFYGLMGVAGFFGIWMLFMTMTAEQFGTNLRATASTTAPNFVRSSIIINAFVIGWLKPFIGPVASIEVVAAIIFSLAALALWRLPETFGKDLDFVER